MLLAAFVCLLAVPSAAGASTILGPVNPNFNPAYTQALNFPSGSTIFTASGPPSLQLTAPYDGVITGWRIYTDDTYDETGLRLRRIARLGPKTFVVTGADRVEPLSAAPTGGPLSHNLLHTYSAQLPISANEIVGVTLLRAEGVGVLPVLPVAETDAEKAEGWSYGCLGELACEGNPREGITLTASFVKEQWVAMNATLEADVDHDGLGDETQDPCVGACLPKETAAPAVTPTVATTKRKKCKKSFVKRKGKCVKKKHRKRKKR